jgi:hypothetical protein
LVLVNGLDPVLYTVDECTLTQLAPVKCPKIGLIDRSVDAAWVRNTLGFDYDFDTRESVAVAIDKRQRDVEGSPHLLSDVIGMLAVGDPIYEIKSDGLISQGGRPAKAAS